MATDPHDTVATLFIRTLLPGSTATLWPEVDLRQTASRGWT